MLVGEIVCDRAEYDLWMTILLEGTVEAEEAEAAKRSEVVADRVGDGGLASPGAAKEEAHRRSARITDPLDEAVQRLLTRSLKTSFP